MAHSYAQLKWYRNFSADWAVEHRFYSRTKTYPGFPRPFNVYLAKYELAGASISLNQLFHVLARVRRNVRTRRLVHAEITGLDAEQQLGRLWNANSRQ
jgi:hypothetical protein